MKKTIIFTIIIFSLIVCIVICGNILPKNNKIISNKALKVLEYTEFNEYENDKMVVLKVKNTSSQVFNNVTPKVIYYDSNNMPIHEGWASRISYFEPGTTRYIELYDTIDNYSKMEVGLFDREDSDIKYEDLRDKITYKYEKANEPDENGVIRLNFKGENKSDKNISVEFQIAYYSGKKLIYEDQFMELIEANSSFNTYEECATKYYDGTKFPEGYTYEVNLVEAVEYIDDTKSVDEEEAEILEEPKI